MSKWKLLAQCDICEILPEPRTLYTLRFGKRIATTEENVMVTVKVTFGTRTTGTRIGRIVLCYLLLVLSLGVGLG